MSSNAEIAQTITLTVLRKHFDQSHTYRPQIQTPCYMNMSAKLYSEILQSLIYEQKTRVLTWLAGTGLVIMVGGLIYKDYRTIQRIKKQRRKYCSRNKKIAKNVANQSVVETRNVETQTNNDMIDTNKDEMEKDEMEKEKLDEPKQDEPKQDEPKQDDGKRDDYITRGLRTSSPVSVSSFGDFIELHEDLRENIELEPSIQET